MIAELRALSGDPFELLVQLERRLRSARLDTATAQLQQWVGLGFRLGDRWLVAPRQDVREVIPMPRVTRIPNARSWLLGLANVRGNLLTIVDLAGLLQTGPQPEGRAARVLVFNSDQAPLGLLVDEVIGYRTFTVNEQRRDLAAAGPLAPYALGGFVREGRPWLAFSLHKLVQADVMKQAGW